MLTVSRKYELVVKTNPSAYIKANKEVIVPGNKIIGSSVTAVNKMISLSNELKVLMPDIIGLASTSPDWDKMVARYWNSLSEPINPVGKTLQTGFVYDITSADKQAYIIAVNEQLRLTNKPQLKTDEDLKNYIYDRLEKTNDAYDAAVLAANKLSEKDKDDALKAAYDAKYNSIWAIEGDHYKVGMPIVPFEYLLWKYCLVFGEVANEFAFADKSTKIRFYLSSEDAQKELEKRKLKTKEQAMSAYLNIISSRKKVIDILFAMDKGSTINQLAKDHTKKEDLDLHLHILLQSEMEKDPTKFISMSSDKNVATKGLIEKYIAYNILKRLQGTNIIVDYADSSKIVGNDLEAAVTFFSNQENAATISEYETRFKDLNSNLDVASVKEEVKPPAIVAGPTNPPATPTANPAVK